MSSTEYLLLRIVSLVATGLTWAIIIRAVISWFRVDPYHPAVQFLDRITEPILSPFRRLLPPWKTGGLDISPILAIITIQVVRDILVRILLF